MASGNPHYKKIKNAETKNKKTILTTREHKIKQRGKNTTIF